MITLDDLSVLGEWMERDGIIPTEEEVEELMWIVEANPCEFDYTTPDIVKRCVDAFSMDEDKLNLRMACIAILLGD